jgi:AraC-like DNA-binding protein
MVAAIADTGRLFTPDRMSSSLITCICQDRYGYIWMGTEYGLNKFDGYRFTPYLHQRDDTTSITDNEIASLFVDKDGELWVGCAKGLVRYDYERDAFLAKPFSMEELHILINNLVDNVRRLRGKFSGAQDQEERLEQVKVKGNNDVLMDRIMKSVNANLNNPDYDVEMLTKDVGISRAQLHRKMKEITGISTSEFIRNLRLEQAARLIKERKINVTQVAYAVGFNNQTHFSTVFKKHYGMTPTEYAEHQDI